jgi:hypothetical protein
MAFPVQVTRRRQPGKLIVGVADALHGRTLVLGQAATVATPRPEKTAPTPVPVQHRGQEVGEVGRVAAIPAANTAQMRRIWTRTRSSRTCRADGAETWPRSSLTGRSSAPVLGLTLQIG